MLSESRVLPFDSEAGARDTLTLLPRARSIGRPIAPADGQIAAIARSRDMVVATRNVRDFEDIDIEVVDTVGSSKGKRVELTHAR